MTTSQVGRPDDGTDTTGFFNTEYFVHLKQKEQWRPVFHENKDELIGAMNRELEKMPGVIWNFSQPIADNMEEAVSGVKGELAVKIYGDDLKTAGSQGRSDRQLMRGIPGIEDLGLFRVLGQPNLNLTVDRDQAARFQINVADVQDAIQTAVGGNAVSQVLQGEQRYDLVVRYLAPYRDTEEAIENIRLLVAIRRARVSGAALQSQGAGWRFGNLSRGQYPLCRHQVQRARPRSGQHGGRSHPQSESAGEASHRVSHRLGGRVRKPEAFAKAADDCAAHHDAGDLHDPLHHVQLLQVVHAAAGQRGHGAGGRLAGPADHPHALQRLQRASAFWRLFGVSVQTGVIMVEYINQLRVRGHTIIDAAVEGAVLRLRPIMMTMLVATLGLLPAALSHGIGSDSQRPFAIVIVGGLVAALLLSIFLLPTLYVWIAGNGDVLPSADGDFEEA